MIIEGNRIIITGGAGEIGSYLVNYFKGLVKEVIVIDIIKERPKQFVKEANITYFGCDLTDPELTKKTISDVFEKFPDISILVNNAGKIHNELMYDFLNRDNNTHSIKNWNNILNINLNTTFYCSLFVVEKLIAARTKGLIINVSSISANGNAGQSAYSAAKAGINALTVAWSRELSAFDIRVAGIAPGFIDTESTKIALDQHKIKKISKEIPLRRLGSLWEIAEAVKFIIENDYFNGKILELDGGMVLSHG